MSIFKALEIANNGLATQRQLMELTSLNVSNQLTPGYKSKSAVVTARVGDASFSEMLSYMGDEGIGDLVRGKEGSGTQVAQVIVDTSAGPQVYMPDHPLADADGNVEMSNVDSAGEMIKMMEAVRQYKANLSIVEMAKKASQEALNMTKNS